MGKFSRSKGARNERLLVAHLKELGYSSLRVPLSGAMVGYKHDVIATKNNVTYTFELKVRANEYATIYHDYNTYAHLGIYRAECNGVLFSMSNDFEKVKGLSEGFFQKREDRTTKKISGMNKLLNGAEYLVIRGDRQGFLFVRYG